jgi:hypothetical protein
VIPLGPYTALHHLGMHFGAGASICSSSARERRRLATDVAGVVGQLGGRTASDHPIRVVWCGLKTEDTTSQV